MILFGTKKTKSCAVSPLDISILYSLFMDISIVYSAAVTKLLKDYRKSQYVDPMCKTDIGKVIEVKMASKKSHIPWIQKERRYEFVPKNVELQTLWILNLKNCLPKMAVILTHHITTTLNEPITCFVTNRKQETNCAVAFTQGTPWACVVKV